MVWLAQSPGCVAQRGFFVRILDGGAPAGTYFRLQGHRQRKPVPTRNKGPPAAPGETAVFSLPTAIFRGFPLLTDTRININFAALMISNHQTNIYYMD
jgi:hypothetical protein